MTQAAPDPPTASASARSLIPAKVGLQWLAFEAHEVQEVIGARPWTPAPHATPLLPGLLPWRGRAVAVLDLAVLGGAGERLDRAKPRPRTLIIQARGCLVAMPVDVVREVQEVDADEVRRPDGAPSPHWPTEALLFGERVPVVDLAALVEQLVRTELHAPE